VALSVTLEVGVAAGISAGLANWWLMFHDAGVPAAPVRKAGDAIVKVASKAKLATPVVTSELSGHWMDATEADTQPIPVIRADWTDEHASAAAETFEPAAGKGRAAGKRAEPPPPRRDIVDETDDRGGHIIYVDPYAWDRD
jgi:hypothetical protein